MKQVLGLGLMMLGSAVFALAGNVPEVDPSSAGSALALLAGGLVVLRARRVKK